MNKVLISLLFAGVLFSGCSVFTVGDRSESICDGECNFKEAGVCADTITIYKHRKELKNRKVKEHWFSEDDDPYIDKNKKGAFTRLNEEDLYD